MTSYSNDRNLCEARSIVERNAGPVVDEWMSASAIAGTPDIVLLIVVSADGEGSIESYARESLWTPFEAARVLGVGPEDPRILVLLDPLPPGMIWVCVRSGPIAETFGVKVAELEVNRLRADAAPRRIVH